MSTEERINHIKSYTTKGQAPLPEFYRQDMVWLIEQLEAERNGYPHEQPLTDVPMDRQIVLLNRQVAALQEELRLCRAASA